MELMWVWLGWGSGGSVIIPRHYMYVHFVISPYTGNRTFLVVNNSNLMKLAQMYEFIAEGPQEKKQ